jgi:hypothetical protein
MADQSFPGISRQIRRFDFTMCAMRKGCLIPWQIQASVHSTSIRKTQASGMFNCHTMARTDCDCEIALTSSTLLTFPRGNWEREKTYELTTPFVPIPSMSEHSACTSIDGTQRHYIRLSQAPDLILVPSTRNSLSEAHLTNQSTKPALKQPKVQEASEPSNRWGICLGSSGSPTPATVSSE